VIEDRRASWVILGLLALAPAVATDALAAEAAPVAVGEAAEAEGDPADPFLDTAVAELDRLWESLSTADEPAHWLALGFVDRHVVDVEATHGSASAISERHYRLGDVDMRVGTPELDNTHKIRDAGWFSEEIRVSIDVPLTDDRPLALRNAIWLSADETYRSAVRRLIKVRTNDAVKVEREDQSADFSAAPVIVDVDRGEALEVDAEAWRDIVRAASAVFLEYPDVYDSNVSMHAQDDLHTFISSDGTRIQVRRHRLRVSLYGNTIADDGMSLNAYDYIDATTPDGLPDEAGVIAMAHTVAQKITDLRAAPLVDPYVGPAILRGRAAAVFFHEIMGHRIEGHRQKDEDEGQTLTRKVGEEILPPFISVYDDPTRARWSERDLNGHYRYDDEGVAAERVSIVDKGVLQGFLTSRSPIAGHDRSNGHGRRQPGSAVVARQGNLVVEAHETVSYDALRDQLLDELEVQDKPFGLIFDDISGGFTFTGRSTPNSYAVKPVTVWRVHRDGRPDELVRGVDLIGTPLITFSRIVGASDEIQVFNGSCGAESGWVPVSAIAPDLLVDEVEVQRTEKGNDRPPLLEPPGILHTEGT